MCVMGQRECLSVVREKSDCDCDCRDDCEPDCDCEWDDGEPGEEGAEGAGMEGGEGAIRATTWPGVWTAVAAAADHEGRVWRCRGCSAWSGRDSADSA
jgi:hypothetical protein